MCDSIRDLAAASRDLPAASLALSNGEIRARLLDAIADALDAARAEIISTTADETALTPEELAPEFDRMTGTLRMFAALVRDGSWVRASIDTPAPAGEKSIGPNHDVRKMLVPLGPVAVFGASNFPLAYGVCGGDTASALAAGCPVIVKEHPAHPKTGRILHRLASAALASSGCAGPLGYINDENPRDHALAKELVEHPAIAAVGFTGSTQGGLALEAIARARKYPIPVYAEMGSLNPVFITPAAARDRATEIADAIADSLLARVGQQCTKPGVVIVQSGEDAERLFERLRCRFLEATPRAMLSPWIREQFEKRLSEHSRPGDWEDAWNDWPPDLSRPPAPVLKRESLPSLRFWESSRQETFGPHLTFVGVDTFSEVIEVPLESCLALSLYFDQTDPRDAALARLCLRAHGAKAGRISFNSVPTGVRVCTSMVHGGPFPATNRPETTAVGPLAIERWCRPVCFQNCPDAILPPELQNANPRGIWRTVNGQPTRSPIGQ